MTEEEREAWALFRYRLISPLLDPAASRADKAAYVQFVTEHPPTAPTGQPLVPSIRTLERYQAAYRQGGFEALRPHPRADMGSLRAIPAALWDPAVAFKREVPERSAEQVLALLTAWCPTVGLDPHLVTTIHRSTLYRHWQRAGITKRRLRTAAPKRYRRWEAPEPGALWQTDVMNGPYIPDPTPEDPHRKRATYCLVLMDDFSRRIVAGRFAWAADSTLLEALLWDALQKWGAPERLYTDNGAIYTSDRLDVIGARLNIRLIHTPPYTPSGKGKQERLWGSIQASFLPELRVEPARSLGHLNRWFGAWCDEHYHRRVHRETGETPFARWGSGGGHRALTWAQIREAFRIELTRWVDKTGQIRFQGERWMVPEGLLQTRVQLRLDPHQPDAVAIWYQGQYYGPAVKASAALPPESPLAAPVASEPAGPGLSYLTVLAERQAARRPTGVRYHRDKEEGDT